MPASADHNPSSTLKRALGLRGAIALNMLDMIGVGPFITLPLILAAMGGPQAMLGWVLRAGLAVCDGPIWTAMPEAGEAMSICGRRIRGGWAMAQLFVYLSAGSG